MVNLSKGARESLTKTFSALTAITTVMSLTGFAYLAPIVRIASAATPADYGLKEGDTVSAAGSDDPDVYIVNEMGYKRLFLNPAIFGFYGHLGGFAKVKNVSPATRDAFPTSGLFRNCETGDQKVYGVETTGEDTGMLHWVNTSGAQAVADDANFFKKVFCVNNNEFDWYSKGSDYTSVSQVPSYVRTSTQVSPTPVPGAVSVSLAPGNPAAATVTTNAQGVEFLRVTLSGNGTVNSMKFKRAGAGSVDDFDNLYVYEGAKRLTSGKSLSSATGEVEFISLALNVSGSKTLSLIGDLSSTAGNVDYFVLNEVKLSSGSVSNLPVSGNNITTSGATGGTVTMTKVGSLANPNVGSKGAQVSEFKITTATEAGSFKRLTMLQGGTVKPADMNNIKLKTGSKEWSGTIDKAGYVVFDMSSDPVVIAKGGEAVFKVYADLSGKKDEDVNLYFENATDILSIGDQFGFGMAATITSMDTAGEAHDVTLQGGVLTIAFNGPSAGNIGTDTSDSVLLRYSMTAVTNIEVKATEFTLCHDPGGNGSFADSADTTNGWADLDDFKVVNEETGQTIIGPRDGSGFTVSDPTTGSCEDSTTGAQRNFTDVYDLVGGNTYNFKVTADIKTANTRSGTALASGDAIQVFLDNFTDDTPSLTVMKYSGTNTSVADADIVPQADVGGGIQTLQTASLTLGLSSAVVNQTLVRGTAGKTAVALTFKAGSASEMKVTDLVLTGYFDEDGSGAFTVGSDGTTSVANLVSSVSIYEVESGTVLSSTPASNQLSNTTGTVTFNNLSWTIPAGATKTLGVRVNLGSNSLADTDYFSFDINATTDVTALDKSSLTFNASNSDPNGATPTRYVTVTNAGSMTVAVAPSTPSDHAVYWGQTGDNIGAWRFNAVDEAFSLENLHFQVATAAERTDATNNVKTVYLEYKNKAGSTLTAQSTFDSVASIAFGFSGDSRPYVPKDGSLDVVMKSDFKIKAEGATSASVSTDQFNVSFIGDSGAGTNTFKAIGEGSSTVLQGDSGGIVDRAQTTDIIVYRVFPEFALVAPSSTKLTTVDPVLTFTVTAKGLPDSKLFFDNQAVASGSIRFEVVASGVTTTADPVFTVRDAADNSIIDTGSISNATATAPRASLSVEFGRVGTGKDIEIIGGGSKTFKIFLDSITDFNTPINTTAGVGSDYFQLVLRDEDDGTNEIATWVANSTNATTDTDTIHVAGFLRLLPLAGYQFTAQ